MKTRICLTAFVFLLAACMDHAEKGPVSVRDREGLYTDVQVWGEENRDAVTVRIQFLDGGQEGIGISSPGAGKVLLDGEVLPADSTRFSGVFYELSKPVSAFEGEHVLVFLDQQSNEYRLNFRFKPLELEEELPEKLKKEPFTIRLQHFPAAASRVRPRKRTVAYTKLTLPTKPYV